MGADVTRGGVCRAGWPIAVRGARSPPGFACALTRRGEVWCQGDNGHGQLGDGRVVLVTTPTLVLEAAPP